MRYVGIIGQQVIKLLGGIVYCVDGCILVELQVHPLVYVWSDQFGVSLAE